MIADRCVVTIARPPRATSASRYATAMALPSSGSVAPPISSINASVSGPASSRISASRSIEDENVERSERIACASPISVRTARKTGRRVPAPAGIGIPHWASIAKRPAVFRTTVLPPAFGPETTSSRRSAGRSRSSGTASPPLAGRAEDSPPQLFEPRVEEGVAGGAERPAPVVRELGDPALADLAEEDPRLDGVQLRELSDRGFECRAFGEDPPPELREQPLGLPPLLGSEQREVVVRLDDLERLDEHRLPRARSVVHDAGDSRAGGGEDRQAVAVVAEHDDRVAQGLVPLADDFLELPRHLAAPAPQLRTRRGERRRRVVAQEPVGAEEPRRSRQKRFERRQRLASRGQQRALCFPEGAAHGLARARRADERPELLGRRRASGGRQGREAGRDVVEARQRQGSVAQAEGDGFVRLGQPPPHVGFFRCRAPRQNRRPSGRRSSQGRDEAEDDVELEGFPVDAVSGRRVYGVARFSSESLRSIFFRAWIILRLRFALGFS